MEPLSKHQKDMTETIQAAATKQLYNNTLCFYNVYYLTFPFELSHLIVSVCLHTLDLS